MSARLGVMILIACGVVHAQEGRVREFKPVASEQCADCHVKKRPTYVPSKTATQRAHQKIRSEHGQKSLACNHCHDPARANALRSTEMFKASFENPSPVCQRCHAEEYRDWKSGAHGKTSGGWDRTRQEVVKWQCNECHDPHRVKFPPMEASPHHPELHPEGHR